MGVGVGVSVSMVRGCCYSSIGGDTFSLKNTVFKVNFKILLIMQH